MAIMMDGTANATGTLGKVWASENNGFSSPSTPSTIRPRSILRASRPVQVVIEDDLQMTMSYILTNSSGFVNQEASASKVKSDDDVSLT